MQRNISSDDKDNQPINPLITDWFKKIDLEKEEKHANAIYSIAKQWSEEIH